MSNKVKVVISGTVQCNIHQTVEMSVDEFKRLQTELIADSRITSRNAESEVQEMIDWSIVDDFYDFEIDGFFIKE